MSVSNTTESGSAIISTCPISSFSQTQQIQVQYAYVVNVTFASGRPPFRVMGSPIRNGTSQCQVYLPNLDTNSFLWPVVTTTPNASALSNITQGDRGSAYFKSLVTSGTPVFQLGDGVQWTAHEINAQADGTHRYFQSGNYSITLEDGGTTPGSVSFPKSGGLRVAETGLVGWVIGSLLLLGVFATSL